jgi:hypothetical protein
MATHAPSENLAVLGGVEGVEKDTSLCSAANLIVGKFTDQTVADALGLAFTAILKSARSIR